MSLGSNSTVRLQILKAILDQFPECRGFARGYLAIYYPR